MISTTTISTLTLIGPTYIANLYCLYCLYVCFLFEISLKMINENVNKLFVWNQNIETSYEIWKCLLHLIITSIIFPLLHSAATNYLLLKRRFWDTSSSSSHKPDCSCQCRYVSKFRKLHKLWILVACPSSPEFIAPGERLNALRIDNRLAAHVNLKVAPVLWREMESS